MPGKLRTNRRQTAEADAVPSDWPAAVNPLHESQQSLRMLIDSAEDYAIFAINRQGKVATWNKGAERIFGYMEAEILGQDFALILHPRIAHATSRKRKSNGPCARDTRPMNAGTFAR